MSYQALYRRWRPTTFDDVVGQQHITQTLKNELVSGRVAHAYLFTGIRGTGKTSTAKIFSRAINCLNNNDGNPCNTCDICKGILDGSILDVVEIDAASNNSVDNIREIREEVIYSAAVTKFKVYIIDEVHMLSTGAFNALLKTLEEPPAHVIFILATTEVHKLPQTILSRCQRFDFRTITSTDVANKLNEVALADDINVDMDALMLIANMAEGSMRDALSILDRCIAFGEKEISYDDVINILGVADTRLSGGILNSIATGDTKSALSFLGDGITNGRTPMQILESMMKMVRNLIMLKLMQQPEGIIEGTKDTVEELKSLSEKFSQEKLVNCIKIFSETQNTLKFSTSPRIVLELGIIKLCMPIYDNSTESMADRLASLEKQIKEGVKIKAVNNQPPQEKVKKEPEKMVEIEFKGKYKEKWKDIVEAIKETNPGLPGFLINLKPAGEGDTLMLIATNENGENALNFLDKENFRNIILSGVEKACGLRPRKLEFERNITKAQNEDLINKIKAYDFVVIHD